MAVGKQYSTSGVTMFDWIAQPRVFTGDLFVCVFILCLAWYLRKHYGQDVLLPAVIVTPIYLFFAVLWQLSR